MPANKHTNTFRFTDAHAGMTLACLLAVVVAQAFLYQTSIDGVFDIGVYKDIGKNILGLVSGVPGSVGSEYPPPATILFFLAYLDPLHVGFAAMWLWSVILSSIVLGSLYVRFVLKDKGAWVIPGAIAATVFVLGPELLFARYDALVAVLLLLCLRARAVKHYGHAAVFLAFACCLKVVPVLLVPALFLSIPRSAWKRAAAGLVLGTAASFALPLLVMGPHITFENLRHMLEYHSNREVQLESTWSGVYMAMRALSGQLSAVGSGHLSVINADFDMTAVGISKAVVATFALVAYGFAMLRRKHIDTDLLMAGMLAFAIAVSPVFSPQYVVWILPLLAACLLVRIRPRADGPALFTLALLTIVIAFATQWEFPLHYDQIINQSVLGVAVLNVRNAAVLLAALFCLKLALFPSARPVRRRSNVAGRLAYLAFDCGLLLAAVIALQGANARVTPSVRNVSYTQDGGLHASASDPMAVEAPVGVMGVSATITFPPASDGRLYVRPDDCFATFTMNGQRVPDAEFCGDGRVVDFAGYVKAGRNDVFATVKNDGGPSGIIILPGTMSFAQQTFSFAALALAFVILMGGYESCMTWFVGRRAPSHPAAVREYIRAGAADILHLPLLEAEPVFAGV